MAETMVAARAGEQAQGMHRRVAVNSVERRPMPEVGSEVGAEVRIGAWIAGLCAAVVLWSVTYLLRQPGVAGIGAEPFSLLGDFALEGAVLALAWLGLVVAGCIAVLRGTIIFSAENQPLLTDALQVGQRDADAHSVGTLHLCHFGRDLGGQPEWPLSGRADLPAQTLELAGEHPDSRSRR